MHRNNKVNIQNTKCLQKINISILKAGLSARDKQNYRTLCQRIKFSNNRENDGQENKNRYSTSININTLPFINQSTKILEQAHT